MRKVNPLTAGILALSIVAMGVCVWSGNGAATAAVGVLTTVVAGLSRSLFESPCTTSDNTQDKS